jgi:tetratricopeptide (TPR) repeat protein
LSVNQWEVRQIEDGIQLAKEVADWPRTGVSTVNLAYNLFLCAGLLLLDGNRDRSDALLSDVEELGERTGDSLPILLSLGGANIRRYMDGLLEDCVEGTKRAADKAEELGSPVMGGLLDAASNFRALLDLGRVEEALAATDQMLPSDSLARTICLVHVGRRAEAQGTLDELARRLNVETETDGMRWVVLNWMMELAILLADRDVVEALAPRLAGLDKYVPPAGANIGRNLGGAKALLGNRDEARAHYLAALEASTRIRHRPEIALTHLELAELLLEHYPDERTEALEHLDTAIAELRDMKMQPALERALSHRDILKA